MRRKKHRQSQKRSSENPPHAPPKGQARYEVLEAKPSNGRQDSAQAENEKSWKQRYALITLISTIAIMVATVASAFVSYGQWTVLAKTDTAVHDALPRGWIFVETKDSGTDTGLAASGGNVSVRFALKNYGTTPALIRDIEAELAVPESGVGNYDLSVDPFEVSQGFVRKEARLFENDLIGRVLTPGEGVSPSHPMWFDFTTLAQVAGRPIREAPKWLRVRVRYVDPNGVNRETSGVYTLSLAGPGTMLLATSKYTYWH